MAAEKHRDYRYRAFFSLTNLFEILLRRFAQFTLRY